MKFAALDPLTLAALMAAGAVFAFAGLWLMFRPKHEGATAKIEVFGMKFESSSAGLLVFLIGAAFVASPLFVPASRADRSAQEQGSAGVVTPPAGGGAPALAGPVQHATVTARTARSLTAVGDEIEENDTIAEANEIAVGSVIRGQVEPDDPDFFSFVFPEGFVGTFAVNLAGPAGGSYGDVRLAVYDDLGVQLSGTYVAFEGAVEAGRYYASVYTMKPRAKYTLTAAARAE